MLVFSTITYAGIISPIQDIFISKNAAIQVEKEYKIFHSER